MIPIIDIDSLAPDESLSEINENLSVIEKKNGLRFGTDSYLLSAFAKAVPGGTAADLGAGTGVVSLICAQKNKFHKIYAFEIQPDFASLIARNAEMNSLTGRVVPVCDDIRSIKNGCVPEMCDTVLSNPPYMIPKSGFDNKDSAMNTARRELNGTIFNFCSAAARLLKYGGSFFTVYRPERLCDLMSALRSVSLEPKRMIFVYPDSSSKPCLVLCEAKKGGRPGMNISPALIIYKDNPLEKERMYTDNFNRVYNDCSLEFMFL